MSDWETVRHQVGIAGRVTDAQTGKPVGGAQVIITSGPEAFTSLVALRALQYGTNWGAMLERPDRTQTAADGHYHLLDLPDGKYTVTATLPGTGTRYGAAQQSVTVSRDSQGRITWSSADVQLPPTTLMGQVSGKGAAIAMAEVRVKGSGERTYSDGQGRYRLIGVEIGNRTLLVSAQGFKPASQAVQLGAAGAMQKLDFAMVPNGQGPGP